MNVLAIGNSFSQDATRYLHQIARKRGDDIQVINLYIPGCPLDRHFRNMLSGEKEYGLECNGQLTGFKVSLREALLNREWDYITIQQASKYSPDKSTYLPYAEMLVEYIRSCAPKAKVIMHETWAYEDGSARIREVCGYDRAADMIKDVAASYRSVAEELDMDGLIPAGELLFALTQNGIAKVHRDMFHASYGLGRYAIGLMWYRTLTGKSVADDTFDDLDEYVDPAELAIARRLADTF